MITAIESVDAITGEVEIRRLSLDELIARAAEVGGVSVDAIKGKSRYAAIVAARRGFCVRARAAGYSWPHMARFINRDHTTAMALVSGKKRKTA